MAEQAILGAILANNRALDRLDFLRPEHFADPVNAQIFSVISDSVGAGRLMDGVTLLSRVGQTGILDDAGGPSYVAGLLASVVSGTHVTEYGRAVHDCWTRRSLIEMAQQVIAQAHGGDPAVDGEAQVTQTIERLLAMSSGAIRGAGTPLGDAVNAAISASESIYRGDQQTQPLGCGLPVLDEMWGGLWPGEQYFLVARSRTGKTPLAAQIARHVAGVCRDRGRGCVHFFSLEMPAAGLAAGSLAALTRISADDIRRGRLQGDRPSRLIAAQKTLASLPMVIEDAANLTLAELILRARAVARQRATALVVIDHRDLIARDPDMRRAGLPEWLPHVTRSLKQLSKAISAPVLLLTQLLKEVEAREDPRPRLGDIPYGGEQDADAILAVHRPELYLGDAPPTFSGAGTAEKRQEKINAWHQTKAEVAGVAEVSFLKRRFGPTGWKRLRFDGVPMLFTDPSAEAAPADLWASADPGQEMTR